MNYCKELLCNNYEEINQEILNFITSTVDIEHTQHFWNPIPVVSFVKNTPLFQEWCKFNGVQIKAVAVTIGKHENCCGVHTDTPPAVFKLSWPIKNTDCSWNRWFAEQVDNCTVEINHLGGKSYLDISQLKEIARKKVDRPMLINAGIPHDVWFETNSKFPRLGLQCQLMKEPAEL